jgi:hypothetical protein
LAGAAIAAKTKAAARYRIVQVRQRTAARISLATSVIGSSPSRWKAPERKLLYMDLENNRRANERGKTEAV